MERGERQSEQVVICVCELKMGPPTQCNVGRDSDRLAENRDGRLVLSQVSLWGSSELRMIVSALFSSEPCCVRIWTTLIVTESVTCGFSH